ncbi:hypothetical protein APR41_15935 [Salegentibacter salinarum]|uniref:Lipocalin-like domain-containing protein n=1 Tax=Salegentibacter salinarum TaxID=447422 RepID=A0A2N0TXJ0_9FLAO|nr:lipocalin family protein [Salegentibacter salinarum]PKD19449.1 hypothetical protein APR41_15935 [Salegentibacter salinarum]SKB92139.1 Lipocalin-like domain-containing protein [Salegentibacter salinarum]
MKGSMLHIILLLTLNCWLTSYTSFSQTLDKETILGTWDIQGNLMGENGKGWLIPHKQSNADCLPDHTVFTKNHMAREVKYNKSCQERENTFNWTLNEGIITLSKGERSIKWHIEDMKNGKMTIGVPIHPGAEKKLYLLYKKRN